MGIVAELSRRNVIRVGVAYLVFAWLALQVLDVIAPILDIPDWVGKTLLVLLALGLAPALFLSWAYELTPEGLKRTHEVTLDESITRQTGRRLDAAVLVLLVLTLGLFGWQRLYPGTPTRPAIAAQPAPVKAPAAQRRSIAVLPFRDMSPGKDQGWFADGLTEEILNSLARLPELMVTARTSAFSFKDSDRPIPDIARTLGVAYIVEGSVRRSDEKLRVTAQLVRATDGFHLWSQSYDRTADDALKVQQDIAGNVARMLDIYLDDKQRAQMFASGTHDPQAFDAYLRGRALFSEAHRTDYGLLWQANALFEEALRHDPRYARAHYLHHDAYGHTLTGDIPIERAPAHEGKPATVDSLMVRLRQDLDAAVATARDESMQLNYEIDRAFVLGDWERFPRAGTAPGQARRFVRRQTRQWRLAARIDAAHGSQLLAGDMVADRPGREPPGSAPVGVAQYDGTRLGTAGRSLARGQAGAGHRAGTPHSRRCRIGGHCSTLDVQTMRWRWSMPCRSRSDAPHSKHSAR